ncbi:hypothetical protein D5086_006678, partial [Populus alba]
MDNKAAACEEVSQELARESLIGISYCIPGKVPNSEIVPQAVNVEEKLPKLRRERLACRNCCVVGLQPITGWLSASVDVNMSKNMQEFYVQIKVLDTFSSANPFLNMDLINNLAEIFTPFLLAILMTVVFLSFFSHSWAITWQIYYKLA